MDLGLAGKIGLITGASSGIGAACAEIMAQEGADVVVSYGRNREGAERAADAVRAAGRRAWLCQMNVTDPDDVRRAVNSLSAEIDALDVLILNAGLNIITPFDQITPNEWKHVMDVNLNGPFYVLQACAPLLRDGGSVVTISSVAAQVGAPAHVHYAAAKGGLVTLSKTAARILAPRRIRVNSVAPGVVLTPMGETTMASMPPDYAQKKLLTGRFATADEIARVVVFVASPLTGYMTGATIDINGGRELR